MKSTDECQNQVDMTGFEIWCDKEADRILINSLKDSSKFLKGINSIQVMPSRNDIRLDTRYDFLKKTIRYDRADFCVFHRKIPILMVEITEHGYTGDNSLQRFARIANAGELGIPLLYLTPFSRTRVDEIEVSEKMTSKRHVSRHLFEGFRKIHDIHKVPIMPFDWQIDENGMPKTLKLNASVSEKLQVFGELLKAVEHLCLKHTLDIEQKKSLDACPLVIGKMRQVDQLIERTPARESEVKISDVSFGNIIDLVYDPATVLKSLIGGDDYFFKGKDHKLVTLMCLQNSTIEKIQKVINDHPYNFTLAFAIMWNKIKDELINEDYDNLERTIMSLKDSLTFYSEKYFKEVLGLSSEEIEAQRKAAVGQLKQL